MTWLVERNLAYKNNVSNMIKPSSTRTYFSSTKKQNLNTQLFIAINYSLTDSSI